MATSPYSIRQKNLLDELDRLGLDALLLNPGPSLHYLTGLSFHLSERPVVAAFRPDGPPVIVLPSLEEGKLADLPYEAHLYAYGEDPSTWPRSFRQATHDARLDYRRVGIEPTQFRVLELRLIEEAAPSAAYLDGSEAISTLRARKGRSEIDRMRRAVRVAETAVGRTLPCIEPGVTERDVASELTAQLFQAGSESHLPFAPIVAFGEASANPHAVPSDRALKEGDLILMDWGASVDGYYSDLTRMFCYGQPAGSLREIVDVVASANEAARKKAGPDSTAGDVDRAARSVIEAAGYGDAFVHRTGHGLGMEVHEAPYIRADNEELLEEGMTFTIEPGIYLPGKGGARIEDDIVITGDAAESLSTLTRRLVDISDGKPPKK